MKRAWFQNAKMTQEIVTIMKRMTALTALMALLDSMESKMAHITLKNLKNVPQVAQIAGSATTSVIRHAKFQNARMTQEIVTITNQERMGQSPASA